MMQRFTDVICVFRIHLARLRAEAGPFILAALVFPSAMYLFASAIANGDVQGIPLQQNQLRFLAGSIVFSLSLTAISWLGYLLLENRFMGRLKLFVTLPLAPSSYVLGILIFALVQGALGTVSLLLVARLLGVPTNLKWLGGLGMLAAVVVMTMLCLSGLSVIIASRARSFSEGSLMTDALGAGLVFLAPVYYAPEMMPRLLRPLALILPTAPASRAVQSILAGGSAHGGDLIALAVMAMISLSLGLRLMRWREI
jgi:ABC-type multidrug transport system permease subunit